MLLGNLLLNDLASMVGSLLPHEFEELLARLLSLATKTLLTTLGMEGSGQVRNIHVYILNNIIMWIA